MDRTGVAEQGAEDDGIHGDHAVDMRPVVWA